MDKHKQFTETTHPIGTTIEPMPPPGSGPGSESGSGKAGAGHKAGKFKFSEADLESDFDSSIDPSVVVAAPASPEPVVVAPPDEADPTSTPDSGLVMAAATASVASISQPVASPTSTPVSDNKEVSKNPVMRLLRNRYAVIAGIVVIILLLVSVGVLFGRQIAPKVLTVTNSAQLDKATLNIDSTSQTVGVKSGANPDGLQVGATVNATPKGAANIRMGLVNGTEPSIFLEDGQKNSWQVLGAGGSLQFVQGTQTRAKLDDKALSLTNALNVGSDANVAGNTTLGAGSGNTVTLQSKSVLTPNNLSFNGNVLFIEANKGNVAIGAGTANGYKLFVAGSLKASSLFLDGQVLATAGSAKGPSFSFNNNTNTGIYEPGLNSVGVAAAGVQVLQVQQGSVFTVNGANLEADGYVRAGRGGSNPAFQIARFTGTLDGSGSASIGHGLGTGYARALNVQGFYRGNSNEALPLNVDFVNSSNLQLSGGIPGRQYRATLIYSQDNAGW